MNAAFAGAAFSCHETAGVVPLWLSWACSRLQEQHFPGPLESVAGVQACIINGNYPVEGVGTKRI